MSFLYDNLFSIVIALVIILIYVKIKKKLNFFSEKGLSYIKPTWKDQIRLLNGRNQIEMPAEFYNNYKNHEKPYIGTYFTFLSPGILVTDTSLVRDILITDFSHFQDHGIDLDYENNPLLGHLFTMNGDKWRTLRHKLVPTFTSGKLKGMVPTMDECADNLIEEMKNDVKLRDEVNMKEVFSKYTTAVIAICAFGIDPKGLMDPECKFKKIMTQVLHPNVTRILKMTLITQCLALARLLKLKIFSKEEEDFFYNLTKDAFEMRKKSGVKRNDFIQLLLELKEKGSVEVDTKDLEEDEKEKIDGIKPDNLTKLELTDELLTAQAFVFLVAGFENTSYLSAITAYILSKHPDIQKKVREEVIEVKNKHGKIDYLALRDMKLLGACMDEVLRMHSPTPLLMRKCNKTYTMSNGEKIDKDMVVIIPVSGLHNDSRYWPNPEQFNPDRFLDNQIHPGAYLPFGDGPRICIAQRLALIIAKLVISKILLDFEILPSPKTKEPLQLAVFKGTDIEGGLWGSFKPIQQ